MLKLTTICISVFAAPACFAQSKTENITNLYAQYFEIFFGLAIVIFLVFFSKWIFSKLGFGVMPGNGIIKIVSSVNIGAREKVLLLSIEHKKMVLIGVSNGSINSLCAFDNTEDISLTSDSNTDNKKLKYTNKGSVIN